MEAPTWCSNTTFEDEYSAAFFVFSWTKINIKMSFDSYDTEAMAFRFKSPHCNGLQIWLQGTVTIMDGSHRIPGADVIYKDLSRGWICE